MVTVCQKEYFHFKALHSDKQVSTSSDSHHSRSLFIQHFKPLLCLASEIMKMVLDSVMLSGGKTNLWMKKG